jgi:hypothetical protein
VLAVLLLIVAGIMQSVPPFSWKVSEVVTEAPRKPRPAVSVERDGKDDVEVTIDEHGVRVRKRPRTAPPAASAPPAAASLPATPAASDAQGAADAPEVVIKLPPGIADSEVVKDVVAEVKQAVAEAAADAREAARDAAEGVPRVRVRKVALGEFLPELAMLWILASAIIKITYKRQLQAEVRAAQATETAEAEQLKRQVVEARMAAMQAQVEPHFLFNTLASIDHLIETDPARASTMQKNLIALLRASMPTMREANAQGVRDLGREMAVIRPYVEILKVRMEERLQAEIDVPEGLHSAEFPPMMIQSLVENAVKHGLEPKPEGGRLTVRAQIVHGKLQVTVADTGLGFGKAATAGTGVGLENIRERLRLLYGSQASLTVAANEPSGTIATITVPYRMRPADEAGDNRAA